MKFGEVDIERDECEGAILAHTLRLGPGAGAIKKGAVLTASDLERLRAAGYSRVMVARLDANDIHEDAAAARLGSLFDHPSIEAAPATTGRCNLLAAHHGVVEIDAARIDAANRVSESATVATLPPRTLVSPDDMVATIKVIPFSVPRAVVESWESRLGGGPALRIAPLAASEAGLVLTELPGVSQDLLERASRAQRARLRSLGSRMKREVRCAHEIEAVSRAIATLRDDGCNPILLLGASAIVDRGDVIPSALERVGGTVTHLGMPVDPGNLLMVGALDQTTVFGLPGCARSLSTSGFDQVLQRYLIGESVDSGFMMSLGVGGLLKETRERPMPRDLGMTRKETPNIAAIVLAAGSSRRMGTDNKLVMPVDGVPMVARVVDALAASRVDRIVVVTGYDAESVVEAVGDRGVEFVHNDNHEEGMGSSVRTGFEKLGEGYDGALVALGDMPWVSSEVVDRLIDASRPGGDLSIYVPMYGRKRGNPVLWGARHFEELRQLSGDVGGKALFHRHPEAICYVDVESAAVNIDIDTPEALQTLGIDGRPGETT